MGIGNLGLDRVRSGNGETSGHVLVIFIYLVGFEFGGNNTCTECSRRKGYQAR